MDERRKFPRFTIEINAKFITEDNKESSCILTDISREGTRVEFSTKEKVEIGTGIKLLICAPEKEGPITTSVIIMWSKALDDDPESCYIAGGLFAGIAPEDKSLLLDRAYAIFKETGSRNK